jgi:hypothetical protein
MPPVVVASDPHQQQSGHDKLLANDQLSEILVVGQQKPLIAPGQVGDFAIVRSGSGFRHIKNVMAGLAKPADKPRRNAFIDEPSHGSLAMHDVIFGNVVGGETLRRPDVLDREMWVIRQNFALGHSTSELAQNCFHRHPSAADHGLSAHNARIHLDPFVHDFCLLIKL